MASSIRKHLKNKKVVAIIITGLIVVITTIYFVNKNTGFVCNWFEPFQKTAPQKEESFYYTCPMHPTVKTSKPGNCPICNMKLVKKEIQTLPKITDHQEHENKSVTRELEKQVPQEVEMVSISPREVILANVKTTQVKVIPINKKIEAFGYITYNTNNLTSVPAWIEGRLDKLYVKAIGDHIRKGDIIAEIYSPELISTQKEYIYAMKNLTDLKDDAYPELVNSYEKTVEAAKKRLKYWGVTEEQILTLNSFEQVQDTIPVYSKYNGTIIKIKVSEGDYVKTGEILFDLADFSTVWLEAEVDESQISDVALNQEVKINIESYPQKTLTGRISYIYPFMDKDTRTARIRVVLPNYSYKLKPDMYARAIIKMPARKILAVPRSAVLYTGKNAYVWVEINSGMYHIRNIQVGEPYDEYFAIESGLKLGEKIVVSGGFLLDSEARLSSGSKTGGHQH
jgi:Cu(I)/Ag(I) efflux system membrane fusion protein